MKDKRRPAVPFKSAFLMNCADFSCAKDRRAGLDKNAEPYLRGGSFIFVVKNDIVLYVYN